MSANSVVKYERLCLATLMGERRKAVCRKPSGHDGKHAGYEPTDGMSSRWWEWPQELEHVR